MTVEELLQQQNISYIPKGHDFVVKCLNPEHNDRTPSLRIDQITGIYNCFSCEFKGNLFTLFGERANPLQLRRESLKKSIKEKLSESFGLVLPSDAVLYEGDWRGIKPETYKKFKAFQHHSKEHIGRIVFPITDMSGRIVAFVGRHTTGETPKYMINPAGAKMPIYPIVKPINGSIILVEGIFDMLNLHDKGLTNAVCAFGTKLFNETKLQMLLIQGVESLDIFFDGDDAGQKAAVNIKQLCDKLMVHSRNICIANTDPGALTQEQVSRLMKKLYSKESI